jgi:hypothetical protein
MMAQGLSDLNKSGIAELTFRDRQKHSGDRVIGVAALRQLKFGGALPIKQFIESRLRDTRKSAPRNASDSKARYGYYQ